MNIQTTFVDELRAELAGKGVKFDMVQQMGVTSALREVADFENADGFVVSRESLAAIVAHLKLCAEFITDMRVGYVAVQDIVQARLDLLSV